MARNFQIQQVSDIIIDLSVERKDPVMLSLFHQMHIRRSFELRLCYKTLFEFLGQVTSYHVIILQFTDLLKDE